MSFLCLHHLDASISFPSLFVLIRLLDDSYSTCIHHSYIRSSNIILPSKHWFMTDK
jgi:hypothetical protein